MARKNKRLHRLREYRDKLLLKITMLESSIRTHQFALKQIRKALVNDDTLTAYATASLDSEELVKSPEFREFDTANELAKELTLVYRMLAVERKYTDEMQVAANHKDWLRILALTADHQAEFAAHDKMLTTWSKDHGFKSRLIRNEVKGAQ